MIQPRRAIAVAKARELLNELKVLEPEEIDIDRIAFFKDAEIRYEMLEDMDGRIVREGKAAIITVNKKISFEGQRRFVIAHELGHYFLHPKTRQVESVNQDQTNNWSEKQDIEEYEANLFAAELLMPSSMFSSQIKGTLPSFDLIESLQKKFRTTLTATAVQFVLNTKEECALVSVEGRQRKWFILSPGFTFQMLEDTYIHGCSCAATVGPIKRADRSSQIEAGYWLEGYRGYQKALITEDARYFPTLGKCLSLLWINNVI